MQLVFTWNLKKVCCSFLRRNQSDTDFGDYCFKRISSNQYKLEFINLVEGDKKIDNQNIAKQVLDKII
jgi:hypothetical protein